MTLSPKKYFFFAASFSYTAFLFFLVFYALPVVSFLQRMGIYTFLIPVIGLSFAVIVFASLFQARSHASRSFASALISLAAIYLFLFFYVKDPIQKIHLGLYALLALIYFRTLGEYNFAFSSRLGGTLILGSLVGILDEGFQKYIPGRFFEWLDLMLNVAAVAMGSLYGWIRHSLKNPIS